MVFQFLMFRRKILLYPRRKNTNSENVLVVHEMPEVANAYLAHWQSRWRLETNAFMPFSISL